MLKKGSGVACHAWLSVWCCSVHRSILRMPFPSASSRLPRNLLFWATLHSATTGCLLSCEKAQTISAPVFLCRCCNCCHRSFGRKGQSHGTVSSHAAFFVSLQRMAARMPPRGPKCLWCGLSGKISSWNCRTMSRRVSGSALELIARATKGLALSCSLSSVLSTRVFPSIRSNALSIFWSIVCAFVAFFFLLWHCVKFCMREAFPPARTTSVVRVFFASSTSERYSTNFLARALLFCYFL